MNIDRIQEEYFNFPEDKHGDIDPIEFAEHIAKLVKEECAVMCESAEYGIPLDVWCRMTEREHSAFSARNCAKVIRGEIKISHIYSDEDFEEVKP